MFGLSGSVATLKRARFEENVLQYENDSQESMAIHKPRANATAAVLLAGSDSGFAWILSRSLESSQAMAKQRRAEGM